MNDQDHHAIFKVIAVWVATMAGSVTLNELVLVSTLIFTVLQIFMICRRLWKGLP